MSSAFTVRASRLALLLVAVVLPLGASPLAAALVPVAQERTVDAFAIVPQCGGEDSVGVAAAGFGPFQELVTAALSCDVGSGLASAQQRSRITDAALEGTGRALSFADASMVNVIHAIADTRYEVTFAVPAEVGYTLRGDLVSGASDPNLVILAGASVVLLDANGAALFEHAVEPGPMGERTRLELDEGGLLAPGTYTFRALADTVIDNDVPPGRFALASFRVRLDTQ